MKITRITLNKSAEDFGVPDQLLERLNDLVILTGRNGAGKSRIMNAVRSAAGGAPSTATRDAFANNVRSAQPYRAELQERLSRLQLSEPTTEQFTQKQTLENETKNQETNIRSWQEQVERHDAIMSVPSYRDKSIRCVEFLPTVVELADDRALRDNDRHKRAEEVFKLGTGALSSGTTSLIRRVQSRYYEATHPASTALEDDKSTAIKDYQRLNDLVTAFLGEPLKRSTDGYPTLFGKHLVDTRLSDGQSVLLQLCVQLFAQQASLSNLVLFLDEPENHLHPAACIDMIDSIRKAAPDCQIWLATHSLPVLSYYYSEATLLFVEDGVARFAGSTPEKVFSTLLGNEERIGRLRDFLSLPAVFALNKFGAECLLPPKTIGAAEGDAQTAQIRAHLEQLRSNAPTGKLRTLDYGAGKGRLLENLTADWPQSIGGIDYVAFDEFAADGPQCRDVIRTAFGNADGRYYNELHDLKASVGLGHFDVIVLCNVLHEIPPANWTKLFGTKGDLIELLAPNGVILLVEDEEIPVGEKAHHLGFIVLDTSELRALFNIKVDEKFPFSDQRNNGRLKAHVVSRNQAARLTSETRKAALEERVKRAERGISVTRSSSQEDFSAGRLHAFWVHQFANASLALRELG